MPLVLPVFPGEPLYLERVRLEGRDYIFRFDWAEREQRHYMSLQDPDGTSLLAGVKVVANWSLTTRHLYNLGLPPGQLIPIDLENGGTSPTFNDFGTRVRLFYYLSTEIAGLSEFDT
jgi:hypothetical protein